MWFFVQLLGRTSEGQGVCDVQAQLPKIKSSHPKPKKYHIAKQQQKHLNPNRSSHHNTPLYPLSRGENQHPKSLITNKKTASQTFPLERGRGCVTHVHSHPTQKQPPKANRHLLKKQLKPIRASLHNTPLNPLSRGESSHSNHSFPTKKHHPNLPSRE